MRSPSRAPRRHPSPRPPLAATLLLALAALAAASSLAGCSSPEREIASLHEEMATVVERHHEDCDAMANALKDFIEENAEDYQDALTEERARVDRGTRACSQDRRGESCLAFKKSQWRRAEIHAQKDVAHDKIHHYTTAFCSDHAGVREALSGWRRLGEERR